MNVKIREYMIDTLPKRMRSRREIHERFEGFFYQEENFNFSYFKRKLKFYIFNYLKFCFKIPKI